VASRGPGDSFGELALLYNCPRAATIQADVPGKLWALDRVTFRYMVASTREGQLAEIVRNLRGVEMLKTLTEDQLNRVAEAVKVVTYKAGELIIRKGELGNEMYFVKRCARRPPAHSPHWPTQLPPPPPCHPRVVQRQGALLRRQRGGQGDGGHGDQRGGTLRGARTAAGRTTRRQRGGRQGGREWGGGGGGPPRAPPPPPPTTPPPAR
jgi:hypothetical protein